MVPLACLILRNARLLSRRHLSRVPLLALLLGIGINGSTSLIAFGQLTDPKAKRLVAPRPAAAPPRKYHNAPAKAIKAFEEAVQLADERKFDEALKDLESLTKKYPSFPDPWFRRGSILASMAQKHAAYESYKRGVAGLGYDAAYAPEYFTAGELGLQFGDYDLARAGYGALLKANPRNKRGIPQAELGIQICDFAAQQLAHPAPNLNPRPLPAVVNQFRFHYFPAVTADGRALLYTARKGAADTDDENLYLARRRGDGDFEAPKSISPLINSPYNEGAAAISGDGKTLVFTSCYRPDSRGDCDLYYSRRENGAWTEPVNLGPNVNSTWWDSQPTLSADGRTLYFSSARKAGSLGAEDIYVTTLKDDGTWTAARNLGAPINTSGRDMGPFLHASGTTLYYVTDGLVGMGGLDLFRAERQRGGGFAPPQNLGYPLNTYEDESSVYITTDNQTGYYSRKHSASADEPMTIRLYQFDVPKSARSFDQSTVAQGRVFDAVTKKTLAATVQVYDLATEELIESVKSDKDDGEYTVVLTEGHQYAMYAGADDYLIKSLTFDYTDRKTFDPLTLDIYLDPVKAGASIVLNNLFFPTNSFELEKRSKTELDRLKRFMDQYPTIAVEVSGHTDDVGSDAANLTLSENRAKAVYDYLVTSGIKADRLKFKGYGETQPAAPNTSDANRRLNRRIELRIL
jgi:outer membrane protein OmpA-like peptidoglycan-associated protein/tetratricopeptide (TPR) repeat protein